jgi:CRP-like cAMP-binding protein
VTKVEKTFPAGTVIFHEGDPGGDIYIIKSGEVKVYQARGGSEILLAQLGQGELLGAMTATTGTPRTASVKALTDTVVTMISSKDMEKLLKDIPPWANILIKDLIFRLKFMNEIYIQSVSAELNSKGQQDLLRAATRLAKGILANARVQEKEIDGTTVVDLHSSFSPLLDIFLGEKDLFLKIYNLFLEYRLLELKELRQAGKFLSKEELAGLQTFYDMATQHLSGVSPHKKAPPPLAVGERKALLELAMWAKGQPLDKSGRLMMTLAECENRLAQSLSRQHIIHVLQRASAWNLIHLDKADVKISFRPDTIRHVVASMNLIHALESESSPLHKAASPE